MTPPDERAVTLGEVAAETRGRLRAAGLEDDAFEAACLLGKYTGLDRAQLAAARPVRAALPPAFFEDVARRIAGEPLQYLLGEWDFMGLTFQVGPGALIPRADTEILAETALAFLKPLPAPRVLELCFGTGCVGISLAALHPGCTVTGLELSGEALACAGRNIALHRLSGRVKAMRGDMLSGPGPELAGAPFDLLVCNPPYIPSGDIPGLDPSVREYEPLQALDGGPDGLLFYRALPLWLPLLKSGGQALFEVGIGQARDVRGLFERAGLRELAVRDDYHGVPRVVGGAKRSRR